MSCNLGPGAGVADATQTHVADQDQQSRTLYDYNYLERPQTTT